MQELAVRVCSLCMLCLATYAGTQQSDPRHLDTIETRRSQQGVHQVLPESLDANAGTV